jgi:hypothetical protein
LGGDNRDDDWLRRSVAGHPGGQGYRRRRDADWIGFVALLTGAIAQRFLAPQVEAVKHETVHEEDVLLAELREMGQRLQRIEQALGQRPS